MSNVIGGAEAAKLFKLRCPAYKMHYELKRSLGEGGGGSRGTLVKSHATKL